MNKKFLISYTIFASLVFAFSIFFFSYNLYTEYKINEKNAGQVYYDFGLKIHDAAKKSVKNITTEAEKKYKLSNDIHSVHITVDNRTISTLPDSQAINNKSRFVKPFSTKLETPNGIVNISANIYLLKPSSIGYYARLSFLIVLIITLITVILIIFINFSESKSTYVNDDDSDETLYNENYTSNSYENNFELMNTQDTDETDVTVQEEIIDAISDEETSVDEDEVIETKDKENTSSELKSTENKEEIKLPYEDLKPLELDKTPTGLFNPDSGIGWETYLNTRLESELSRAIASEFDLSLFVFQLPNIARNSQLFHNICNYLSIQFQFKDLLFEYKNDCLVAIRNCMNLDEALTFSDKLFSDIKNMIENNDCYIGISSRSIRMVSGERLLLEAEESLRYAKEDKSSPVVAFKVDSAKYQEFLERNNN